MSNVYYPRMAQLHWITQDLQRLRGLSPRMHSYVVTLVDWFDEQTVRYFKSMDPVDRVHVRNTLIGVLVTMALEAKEDT